MYPPELGYTTSEKAASSGARGKPGIKGSRGAQGKGKNPPLRENGPARQREESEDDSVRRVGWHVASVISRYRGPYSVSRVIGTEARSSITKQTLALPSITAGGPARATRRAAKRKTWRTEMLHLLRKGREELDGSHFR